jgi:predicted GTPase
MDDLIEMAERSLNGLVVAMNKWQALGYEEEVMPIKKKIAEARQALKTGNLAAGLQSWKEANGMVTDLTGVEMPGG